MVCRENQLYVDFASEASPYESFKNVPECFGVYVSCPSPQDAIFSAHQLVFQIPLVLSFAPLPTFAVV